MPSYLFICKTCSKQYTEETTDKCRLKCSNCKSNDRKFSRGEHCMQEHLYGHFCSHGHNDYLEEITITLTKKINGKDPKNKENCGMRTLKTLAPDGFKIEDSDQILYIPHNI